MTTLDLLLFGLVLFQQIYWTIYTQRLVNKLMSRNFYEYQQTLGVRSTHDKNVVQVPTDVPDDLGILQDFRLMP